MRLALTVLGLAALVAPLSAAPQTPYGVFITFEDLSGSAAIPPGYKNVQDWGSWTYSDAPNPDYPAQSGATTVTSTLPQAAIQFGEDISFIHAAVVTSQPFAWRLFHQGQLVHTSAPLQPNVGGPPAYLPSGYAGFVDAIEFDCAGTFVVDDFEYIAGFDPGGFGQPYCTAEPNATGMPAAMGFAGSPFIANNDLELTARNLPPNQFGMFLVAHERGFVPMTGISNGNLCLGSQIGRFVGPGQLQQVDAQGEMRLQIDLTQLPQGTGSASAQPGETWRFQAWFRDPILLGSNFTEGRELTL